MFQSKYLNIQMRYWRLLRTRVWLFFEQEKFNAQRNAGINNADGWATENQVSFDRASLFYGISIPDYYVNVMDSVRKFFLGLSIESAE